jgi:hypothetical protein
VLGYHLDHIIVGVRDLPAAVADWRALGLVVTDGGSHPKHGTRNAIVRFPDRSFLELMTIEDREKLRDYAPGLLAMFELHPDGPLSWALRSDDVDTARTHLQKQGFTAQPLRSGEGRRDSGKIATWRTFHMQEQGFPFVLQYDQPPTSEPAVNGLPVAGIAAAIVQGVSAPPLAERLARAFGGLGEDGRVRFVTGEAVVVDEPSEHPGVVGAELLVSDAERATAYLRERDVGAVDGWVHDRRLHGLRLRLVTE